VGKSGAAFGAAALKHVPASFSGHSFHKTMFAAALAFFGLVGLFRHELYLNINTYQLSTIIYKLICMISRAHRFHGYGSLRNVYRQGSTTRGPQFGLKSLPNPRRKHYRVAVVVGRKVNKSAVARNRIRRRLYELVRGLEPQITQPFDIVITVFQDSLLDQPPKQLRAQLKKQFKQAGIIQ
jgi:ribonuclease P protein component